MGSNPAAPTDLPAGRPAGSVTSPPAENPAMPLLEITPAGLYCPAGHFHIDPWRPVEKAVITHAHADHLRWGSASYLVSKAGETVTRTRLGDRYPVQTAAYGERVTVNGVTVSFHPAGHLLGSAQVRVEHRGEVWVVSGDYKTAADPTCEPFEPVRCHLFVTESTFGLPVYRWEPPEAIFAGVNDWWRVNAAAGVCSIVYGYALGKAQRILASIDPSIGPIYTHGATEKLVRAYRDAGVKLPETRPVSEAPGGRKRTAGGGQWAGALVLAPPSAHGSTWARKFAPSSAGIASGWMRIRGTRRRKAVDRGFVISDHADWPGLLSAITATGAERVWVTHGYTAVLVRYLREKGLDAEVVETRFEGETGGEDTPAAGDAVQSDEAEPPAREDDQ